MAKISVEFEGLPKLDSEDREWILENAGTIASAIRSARSETAAADDDDNTRHFKKCCCPKKVKFFFFNSNVVVININAACPTMHPVPSC